MGIAGHAVLLTVVTVLALPALGVHHHRTRLGEDATLSSSSWYRHPLRHHGHQDPPAASGGSGLDQLINHLDTLNRVESSTWKRRDDSGAVGAAMDELQRAVEDYERGAVLPDPKSTERPDRPGARRKQEDLDSMTDEDDKEEDDDEDEDDEDSSDENTSGEDADKESKEADKAGAARRPNHELDDMMDLDYKDTSHEALSDSPPAYSSYSEQKWNNYGTRESLAYTRRVGPSHEAQTSQRLAKEAKDHMVRMMMKEGLCRVPKPMVVNVKQVYPDPSKEYIPHCTILHRCTDQTGCCRSAQETCKPKTTHKVELAFYTTRVLHRDPIVETLTFYNETECECQPIERDFRANLGLGIGNGANGDLYLPARKQRQTRTQLDMPPGPPGSPPYVQLTTHKPGCRCPSKYSPREVPQLKGCTCDCFDRQTDCLRYKRGKAYFDMEDRLCIQTGECKLPECEFGSYMKLSGRCPKKNEKFSHYYTNYRRP